MTSEEKPSPTEDVETPPTPSEADDMATLKDELKTERDRANDYLNQLRYLKADFENYQRRTKREITEIIEFANERLILRLLTQIDDLERAVDSADKAEKTVLVNGLKLILTELKRTLAEEGLQEIRAEGEPFNPEIHEASAVIHSSEYPDQTVVEEMRKGYTLKGKVVRPSMVKVAKRPAEKIEKKLNSSKGESHD
jgi:molecular chaperone GrpE